MTCVVSIGNEGAAGAGVEGAVNGLIKPLKKLPKWAKDMLGDAVSVGATAIQKWVDGEEYSWKDAAKDFANKLLDRGESKLEDKYPAFKKFKKICASVEKYTGYSGAVGNLCLFSIVDQTYPYVA